MGPLSWDCAKPSMPPLLFYFFYLIFIYLFFFTCFCHKSVCNGCGSKLASLLETECASRGQKQMETHPLMEWCCSWATDTNSRAKNTNSQVFEMSCRSRICCCRCWVWLCYRHGKLIRESFLDYVLLVWLAHSLPSLLCSFMILLDIFHFYYNTRLCTKWA